MAKEVEFRFSMGAALSPTFKSAMTGAKMEFTGLASRIKDLEKSDVNRLGSSFLRQKDNVRALSAELLEAKTNLARLQNQSKGAGKDTRIFELQVKQAEQEVKNLSSALDRSSASYQKTIAEIKTAKGSVTSLAGEYAKLSNEIEKTRSTHNTFRAIQSERETLRSNRSHIQSEMVQTAVPMLALSVPIKQAMDFETAMADVAKTMDGMRDEDGNLTAKFYEMEQSVKNMARTMPLAHEEIAGLFAAAGQQGLTELSEIEEFVTMSAQMAVAFGISQEQAADAIGGYRASLGLSFDETRSMLDLMNQFANTSSATEQDIAEVVKRVGALGQQAGVSVKAMTAMTANLVSMKIAPEIAGTGIKNFLLALTAGSAATKTQSETFKRLGFDTIELAEAMQNDAPNAIRTLLSTIKQLPEAERLSTLNQLFGTDSITSITSFNLDKLTENLELSADATQYAGAMQKEYENRCNTSASQLKMLANKTKEASINMGSALVPALNSVMDSLSPMIIGFAEFIQENPALVKYLVGTTGALLGLKMAGLATMYVINGLRSAYLLGKGAVAVYTLATQTQTYSMAAQKVAMMANAVSTGALTLAQKTSASSIALLTSLQNKNIMSLAAQKTAMFAHAVATNASSLATKAMTAGQWLLNAAMSANPIGIVIRSLSMAAAGMYALYQTCEPVRNAFDWVFGGIADFIQSVWEKMKMLWEGAKSVGQALGFIDEDIEVNLEENKTSRLETIVSPAGQAVANQKALPEFPAVQAMENPNLPAQMSNEELANMVSQGILVQHIPAEISASPAAQAVTNPSLPSFPGATVSQDYAGAMEKEFSQNISQNSSNVQNNQISVPMSFNVQGLDEKEFRRQMENARPDIENIVKKVVENISHNKARVSFAN